MTPPQVEDIVGGFIEMICMVDRLLANRELEKYVEGAEFGMSGSVAELITDERPNQLLEEIKGNLERAFNDAQDFKNAFNVSYPNCLSACTRDKEQGADDAFPMKFGLYSPARTQCFGKLWSKSYSQLPVQLNWTAHQLP